MDNQIKQELEEEVTRKIMVSHVMGVFDMVMSEKTDAGGKASVARTEARFKKLSTDIVDLVLAAQAAGVFPIKAVS